MRPRVAVLTGNGPGAVAVVRVWGAGALDVADAAFRPHRGGGLATTPPGRPRLGRVGAGQGDEVVAVVFPGEPPEVEIQGHGGPAALELVMDALVKFGAERTQSSAWVRHSCPTSLRAEARLDLPRAATLRAAAHLLDQAEGALDRGLSAVVEASGHDALESLDRLIRRADIGLRLVEGWRVVVAGRPNVGKSRLVNALLGYDRTIVDPTPGTTRDVVTTGTAFDGWPVELADTAGLRDSADPIEAEGIARARARQRGADLVVLVLDRSEPLSEQDHRLIAEHPNALVVANKADLPAAWDFAGLCASAAQGDGIEELASEVGRRLVPDPPTSGSALPFRPRHVRRLRLIREAIEGGRVDRANSAIIHWVRTR